MTLRIRKNKSVEKNAIIECDKRQIATKKIAIKCGFEYQGPEVFKFNN